MPVDLFRDRRQTGTPVCRADSYAVLLTGPNSVLGGNQEECHDSLATPFSGIRVELSIGVPRQFIIGRDAALRISPHGWWVDDEYTSRQHARLIWDGYQLLIEDIGSSHGFVVSNIRRKSGGPWLVLPGSTVRIGRCMLTFQGPENHQGEYLPGYVNKSELLEKIGQRNPAVIVESDQMLMSYWTILKFAPGRDLVLITGPSGAGKEEAAKTLHSWSELRDREMKSVNCGGLQDSLLRSELFGHAKGAFSGANSTKIGLFENARETTLFLDEIGELSLETQAALLRVIEDRYFSPVGSNRKISFDGRLICATNRNLREEVTAKRFREDLYFRLSAFQVVIPPLDSRKSEIPSLAEYLLNRYLSVYPSLGHLELSPEALQYLAEQPWPGNARQLDNLIKRTARLANNSPITPEFIDQVRATVNMAENQTMIRVTHGQSERRNLIQPVLPRKRRFEVDAAVRAGRIKQLRAQGLSLRKIGEECGCSAEWVRRILADLPTKETIHQTDSELVGNEHPVTEKDEAETASIESTDEHSSL